MAKLPFNKYGEIEVSENKLSVEFPLAQALEKDLDTINEMYQAKQQILLNDENYDESLYMVASEITQEQERIYLKYNGEGLRIFSNYAKKLSFEEQLYLFSSLVDLGKQHEEVGVYWNNLNFVYDIYENQIKTMLFDFGAFPIYNNGVDALQGVKSLIIVTLTHLKQYYGKPRKTDFVQQNNPEVIRFAEQIILAKTIDELNEIVESHIADYEQRVYDNKKQEEERKANSRMYRLVSKLPVKKKKKQLSSSPREIHYGEIIESDRKRQTKKFAIQQWISNNNRLFYSLISALAFIFLVGFMVTGNGEESSQQKNEENNANVQAQEEDQVTAAYREARNNETAAAISSLERVGYENLNESDQAFMIDLYIENGDEVKAINLNEGSAERVVNSYVANGEKSKIKDLNKKTEQSIPAIQFEAAAQAGDWKQVIDLKDKVQMNGRQEQDMVRAYMNTDQEKEAQSFVKEVGNPDLNNIIESHKKEEQLSADLEEKRKELEELQQQKEETDNEEEIDSLNEDIKSKTEKINELKNGTN